MMFRATALNERNRQIQRLFGILFGLMTAFLVLPVLIIFGVLLVNGAPAISLEFLFSAPVDQGRAGGILPAIVGTIWLVTVALVVGCYAVLLARYRKALS